MQSISLYWFTVQQQTSLFRRRKFGLFYLEFSAKFSLFSIAKINGKYTNMVATKIVQKNADRRLSEAKS